MKINDCAIIVTNIFDNGWLEKISTEMELQKFAHNTKFKFVPNLTKKFYLEMSNDMQKWIKVLSKI